MFKRFLISAALLMAITAGVQGQVTYQWTNGNGGNWSDGLNWGLVPGGSPAGTADTAAFNAVSTIPGNAYTVTLDVDTTISQIDSNRLDGGAVNFVGDIARTLTLTADNTSGNRFIRAFNNDINFASNISLVFQPSTIPTNLRADGTNTITIGGSITSVGQVNLNGTGDIRLNGVYNGAGTVINATQSDLYLSNTVNANVTMRNTTSLQAEGLSPNSIGTATINGNLSLLNTANVQAQLTNTGNDTIAVTGNVSFATGTTFNVITDGTLDSTVANSFTLLSMGAGQALTINGTTISAGTDITTFTHNGTNFVETGTITGFLTGDLNGFSSTAFVNGDSFTLRRDVSGNLVLDYAPVPEPATMLAIGAAVLGAGAALRRRMGRKAATSVEAEIV